MSEMFCPSCGKDVGTGLSYCNQCGARLNVAGDARSLPATSFNFMVAGVIGLPFIGLGMLIGVIAALKNGMGFKDDFIFAITFLTFILFAIAEIGCLILLLTRTKAPKTQRKKRDIPIAEIQKLEEARRGLGSPTFEPVPVGSVTEHTTRTLDHAGIRERDE